MTMINERNRRKGYESMQQNTKVQIYQGMIQYLLDETGYTLKHIADLSSSHVSNLRSIYCEGVLPETFNSEHQLVSLYQFVLELRIDPRPLALVG